MTIKPTDTPGTFVLKQSLVFLYDGWNLVAELNLKPETSNLELTRSYEWGVDVSGTIDGAGGVGGQLIQRHHQASSIQSPASSFAPCFDGNGNITELVNLATNTLSGRYEYGPFGETMTVDGRAVAEANPFRFSTKYLDGETETYDFVNRIYRPRDGRWLSRDSTAEAGGVNLYGMVGNDPINSVGMNPRANQWHWPCQPIWENEIKKAARFRTLLGEGHAARSGNPRFHTWGRFCLPHSSCG